MEYDLVALFNEAIKYSLSFEKSFEKAQTGGQNSYIQNL